MKPRAIDLARRGALVFAATIIFLPTCACSKKPTAEECGQMLDRYVDMTAGQAPEFNGLSEERAAELRAVKRAQKRLEPTYTKAIGQCLDEVSRAELECAMKAPTPNDWEACID
jgi:hypothetical protein